MRERKKTSDETPAGRERRLEEQRQKKLKLKKEKRLKIIGASVRRMRQRQIFPASTVPAKVVSSPPAAANYYGEVGVGVVLLNDAIIRHFDDKVRRLAGKHVRVLPETAELFTIGGSKKIRVGVIPLDLPNPEQVMICLDFIQSKDPVVNGLRA